VIGAVKRGGSAVGTAGRGDPRPVARQSRSQCGQTADIAWYLGAMDERELVRCRRCTYMFDPSGGPCPVCGAKEDDFRSGRERLGGLTGGGLPMFANLSTFSQIVARLQWDATAIDLAPDARAWPGLPGARRGRLTTLLAGFCVAEEAVSEHLVPFAKATDDTLEAWVFFLQRRDEERHALLFDRIAAEVLGVPGATPAQRREAARAHVPAGLLELFEVRLPALAAELAAGRAGLEEGVSLYHMVLEGIVFTAGQRALLDDLADGALPGVREGVEHVDLDERWHIGFGLRCLIEAQPSSDLIQDVLAGAEDAAAAWGDAVPTATRERAVDMCARRLAIAGLTEARAVA
jgi:ribonucleoside-diphosphate reductase beta chain